MEKKQPILYLENITQQYQNKIVLNRVSLNIYPHDFLAMIGPSGAGKSTLLRIMNFLEKPTAGQIYYHNQKIERYAEHQLLPIRRNMTMVMQRSVMLAGTVADNIAIGLKLRNFSKEQINQEIEHALAFVGLTDLANQKASTLSGGEMQRVALARAIALKPQILFLDEPTANLDPQNVAIVEELVQNIKQKLGMTVVMVTHNMFQAKRMAQRIIFMHQGCIIEEAPTKPFFEHPQNKLTQDFLSGTMIY